MKKKDKLYTVNAHNKNLFLFGGDTWENLAKQAGMSVGDYQNSTNTFGLSKVNNIFSKGNIGSTFRTLSSTVSPFITKAITGGFNKDTTAGNVISSIGGTVANFLPPGWKEGTQVLTSAIGGFYNRIKGHQENDATKAAVDAVVQQSKDIGNMVSKATSNTALLEAAANNLGTLNISKDGFKDGSIFGFKTNNKGTEAYNNLVAQQDAAQNAFAHNLLTSTQKVDSMNDDNVMLNFAAYGGPINKDTLFALGGDIQTNGADFTTGLTRIDKGGSHEENPYEGVQVGISRKNGQPNLVEEGETIFDDFVYSKRILIDDETKRKFHISKKAKISYADLSKKLEKESEERPNDPISKAGLTKQLHELADEQERQKTEKEVKEIQEASAQLPPEQQAYIMQQIPMQNQSQIAPMENTQTVLPEEQMIQQQSVEQPTIEQMNAEGGTLNKFDKGGALRDKIYKVLGIHTDEEFEDWIEQNLGDSFEYMPSRFWSTALENKDFINALVKDRPALGDAMFDGYRFQGPFSFDKALTFDFTHGGWGKEDYDAWNGSTDPAWQEALNNGNIKKGMSSDEIANVLSNTNAYKRGTKWLQDSESNRLLYLQQILNSKDAPKAAKDYASKYVDSNGWLDGVNKDYDSIFSTVRTTHPGTYWKTPIETLREDLNLNYEITPDGKISIIRGEVPKDWILEDEYKWTNGVTNNNRKYYKRPVINNVEEETTDDPEEEEVEEKNYSPILKNEKLRYTGLFGPLAGLSMMAAGIGKPDYSDLNNAVAIANQAPVLADYKPIGNYLQYNPMDIWAEQNRLNANANATSRAIQNNSGTLGSRMAGLLANNYNNQIASGDLYRKALEYNNALKAQVAEFNRSTDIQNANAYTQTSATNANIINSSRQNKAQIAINAALQKMESDASWYNSLYGNINGLFKGLGDLGKENAQHNMIAGMLANGYAGTATNTQFPEYLKETTSKKNGGKLNRKKKGLTI